MIIDNKAIKARMREVAIKETKKEVTEIRKMLWGNSEFLTKIITHYAGISKPELNTLIRCVEFGEFDAVVRKKELHQANKLFRIKFEERVEEIMEEKAIKTIEAIIEEFESGSKTD